MKIDRLIGILSILLQQEQVTAPYLAEKFEVSRRTIQRDIEDLCKAGIPLVTRQGQNGGISIIEGYRVDRTLFTPSDMKAILAGLRSLDSVSSDNRYKQLMEKLSVGDSQMITANNHTMINLASWHNPTLTKKIEDIRMAMDENRRILFLYYSQKGEQKREIEPYLLVFQWSSWYIWGYCLQKKDYRLFKLNRMQGLSVLEDICEEREIPEFQINSGDIYPPKLTVKARLPKEMKWRVVEDYGIESFREQADGSLLFQQDFADKEHVFWWILSLNKHVELLEPLDLREEFKELLNTMCSIYDER